MSMSYLPAEHQTLLSRLRLDPQFQALLRAIRAPRLPRYKRSRSAGAKAEQGECNSQQQKDDWIFASGLAQGFELAMATLGASPQQEEDSRD